MPTRAAVLGKPVAHSLSPVLHAAAYAALGLDDWTYQRIEVDAAGLAALVGGAGPDWVGFSVTMPGKRAALEFATEATPRAIAAGAANTLVRKGSGWAADCTDVDGVIGALRAAGGFTGAGGTASEAGPGARDGGMASEAGPGARVGGMALEARPGGAGGGMASEARPNDADGGRASGAGPGARSGGTASEAHPGDAGGGMPSANRPGSLGSGSASAAGPGVLSGPASAMGPGVILGGGGTASAAVVAFAGLGIRTARLVVRDAARAAETVTAAERAGVAVEVLSWSETDFGTLVADASVLVSTVPPAAVAEHAAQLATAACVLDVIYHPWPTPLAEAVLARGGRVATGLDMLLHQAFGQVEQFTGRRAPREAMRHALRAATNNVLPLPVA